MSALLAAFALVAEFALLAAIGFFTLLAPFALQLLFRLVLAVLAHPLALLAIGAAFLLLLATGFAVLVLLALLALLFDGSIGHGEILSPGIGHDMKSPARSRRSAACDGAKIGPGEAQEGFGFCDRPFPRKGTAFSIVTLQPGTVSIVSSCAFSLDSASLND